MSILDRLQKRVDELQKSTYSTLSSLQKGSIPHFVNLELQGVKEARYFEKIITSSNTILKINNRDDIIKKRVKLDTSLLSSMVNGNIKYFLLFIDGKLFPLSKLNILSDDRYSYIQFNQNIDTNSQFRVLLFPFNITYIENGNELETDKILFNKSKLYQFSDINNIMIKLYNNILYKKQNVSSSYFQVPIDEKYKIFKDDLVLFYNNTLINPNIIEYPLNLFKFESIPFEAFSYDVYSFYNTEIYSKNVNIIDNLLKSSNYITDLVANKMVPPYIVNLLNIYNNFDFSYYKTNSYEDNVNDILEYIMEYNPALLNDVYDHKFIHKEYFSGQDLLNIKDPSNCIYFSQNRNGYTNNYLMIYINGNLYDYHEKIIRDYRGIKVELIGIKPEDKIEFNWFYNVNNIIYNDIVIENSNYESDSFGKYIENNSTNSMELFSSKVPLHLYKFDESESLKYPIEYKLTNFNKSILFNNDFYYGKNIDIVSKRQFKYMKVDITSTVFPTIIKLNDDFKYCDNENQYMIFINNKFISKDDYIITLNKYNVPIDERSIYLCNQLSIGNQIDIFYVPYEYITRDLLAESKHTAGNGYLLFEDKEYLNKHIYNYDINNLYINGTKIFNSDISIVDSTTIKVLSTSIHSSSNFIITEFTDQDIVQNENTVTDLFLNFNSLIDTLMSSMTYDEISRLLGDINPILITEIDYRSNQYLRNALLYQLLLDFYIKLFGKIDATDYFKYFGDSAIVSTLDLNRSTFNTIYVDGSLGSVGSYHEINYLDDGSIEIKKTNIDGFSVVNLPDIDINVQDSIYSASVEVTFDLQYPLVEPSTNKLINMKYNKIDNSTGIDYMLYDEELPIALLMEIPLIFRMCNINKNNDLKNIRFSIKLNNLNDRIIISKPLVVENRPYPSDKTGIIPINPALQSIEKLPYNWDEYVLQQ